MCVGKLFEAVSLAKPNRRPREGGDPYAAAEVRSSALVIAIGQHQFAPGLWVPAFAGTTKGEARSMKRAYAESHTIVTGCKPIIESN
jgi:hypothetical protein